jgi:hypothetical protein
MIKGGDPVRCRQCGFRILYKTRTKRCKYSVQYCSARTVLVGRLLCAIDTTDALDPLVKDPLCLFITHILCPPCVCSGTVIQFEAR